MTFNLISEGIIFMLIIYLIFILNAYLFRYIHTILKPVEPLKKTLKIAILHNYRKFAEIGSIHSILIIFKIKTKFTLFLTILRYQDYLQKFNKSRKMFDFIEHKINFH